MSNLPKWIEEAKAGITVANDIGQSEESYWFCKYADRSIEALSIACEALEKQDHLMSYDPLRNIGHCSCRKEINEEALARIAKLGDA